MRAAERRIRYWQRLRTLTLWLLALWFVASFAVVFFARELANVTLWGWPLHFYLAAQGVTLFYLALTGAYALAVRRLDALEAAGRDHGD